MERCSWSLKSKWGSLNKRRTGQYSGFVIDDPCHSLTNLRFADDVLLFAQSQRDAANMLSHLQQEAAQYGLIVHPDKTKVLANVGVRVGSTVRMGDASVEVVPPTGSERYPGRMICLGECRDTEIADRMAAAWRAFAKFKRILCSRRRALASRLKLFDTVVAPAALCGSSAWTVKEERLLTTWRKMLRKIVQAPRRRQETWVEYVTRPTRECDKYM
ncbi:unnamed protein product [Prorocentrum cordatum]|uniref:Reverse transcriptase domain-containing protein n=1 Tax=Prorocentrum cordatum TaxID=2364126 RepID=A0ABN9QZQ8_9DINO|nr:unnamed protein product [Polarella glacialis]